MAFEQKLKQREEPRELDQREQKLLEVFPEGEDRRFPPGADGRFPPENDDPKQGEDGRFPPDPTSQQGSTGSKMR
jgi:hypothetical protein